MIHRRELLRMFGAAALLSWRTSLSTDVKPVGESSGKKILMFTKSSGFEHSVIKRSGGRLSFAEQLLTNLGKSYGFDVTASKDGRVFSSREISQYDAFFFYTTGDLTTAGSDRNPPMSPQAKRQFLDLIHSGKGFIGAHCATDTFDTSENDLGRRPDVHLDPYLKMIGAEFLGHDQQQKGTVQIVDTRFPGLASLGDRLEMLEEWYAFRNYQPDLHILTVLETRGMVGPHYRRPPFPNTWARMHGQGRVFYTALGHREDVWTSTVYQNLLLAGIQWALRNVSADIAPNIMQLSPNVSEIPAGFRRPYGTGGAITHISS